MGKATIWGSSYGCSRLIAAARERARRAEVFARTMYSEDRHIRPFQRYTLTIGQTCAQAARRDSTMLVARRNATLLLSTVVIRATWRPVLTNPVISGFTGADISSGISGCNNKTRILRLIPAVQM